MFSFKKTLFLIFTIILLSSSLYATIINVPANQTTIQLGITAAANTDTVLVQPGIYYENINYNAKRITIGSLFLTTQDTAYISSTIIDGNSSGSVVTFENSENSTAILCGFTITNGTSGNYGGGINCYEASPTLKDLIIAGNSAVVNGGGIYCYNSSPNLENVTISGNSVNSYGGGIFCIEGSCPSLENVTITGNSAWSGGGIYCEDFSSPSLQNVTITDNSVGEYGGGLVCYLGSNPSFENVTISGNSANFYGGGIFCNNSNPLIQDVTTVDNSAEYGGGIFCYESSPSLENVTISGNTATNAGGGLFCFNGSNPSLINCVLWNDAPEEICFYVDENPNSVTIAYSDIEGGEAGIVTNNNGTVSWLDGNIDVDPLFVDAGNGDFHLQSTSPCIDAGDPSSPYDPDGTIADMGAWFYDQGNAIEENEIQIASFNLSNYPNPFNPLTTISFDIKEYKIGILTIFNIKGQIIESHRFESGQHNFQWDATNMSSGVYLYKLQTESTTTNRKMLLLK